MFFLFLFDLILIITFAYLVITACRLPTLPASLVGIMIIAYGCISLTAIIVAEVGFLNNAYAHLIIHFVVTLAALWFWNRSGRPHIQNLPDRTKIKSALHPELIIIMLGVAGLYGIGLYLNLTLPHSSHDSMAYHLARVGYWLQYNSLHPYPTYEILQTSFPVNSSLAMLWTILFWGNDQLAGLFQWLAVVGSTISIYGLARLIGGTRPQSIFAALIWPAFPIVILQSTSTLNDILTAFLAITITYFLFLGLKYHNNFALLLSGLSLGLGLGTKATLFMFLPSLGVVFLFWLIRYRKTYFSRLMIWAIACLIGVFIFGSYIYIVNFTTSANPLGPHASGGSATVAHPTPETIVTNIARYLYQLADTTGLPYSLEQVLQFHLAQTSRQIFSTLKLNENLPEATRLPPTAFTFDGSDPKVEGAIIFGPTTKRNHEAMAWFGPLGFLLLMPVTLYHFFFALFKGQNERWLLAAMAITFFLVLSVLMKWSPFRGRFVAIAAVVATPLLITVFRTGKFWGIFRWGVISISLFIATWTSLLNLSKPLLGPTTIWDVDYAQQRTFYGGPTEFVRAVENYLPPDATVGIVGYHLWEYPLFGSKFTRTVIPLYPYPEKIEPSTLEKQNIDYLVISHQFGQSLPQVSDTYSLLTGGDTWKIFINRDKLQPWFAWALNRSTTTHSPQPLITIDPFLNKTIDISLQLPPHQEFEQLGSQSVLWLMPGKEKALGGVIQSDQERLVKLMFDVLPKLEANTPHTIKLISNNDEANAEIQQFSQSARLFFNVLLQPGDNLFRLELHPLSNQPLDDIQLVLLRHLALMPIIDKDQAEVGPDGYPLASVDPSLEGRVGIDRNARIPWSIEIDEENERSFLWLGHGEAQGLGGIIWSEATRPVVLKFQVSPGPGREDQDRTVRLTHQNYRQEKTFNKPTELAFNIQLIPGENRFLFTVLDEATVPVQPNGDARPLLVRLEHATIKPDENFQ